MSLVNFRDLGGLKTKEGLVIKNGQLWRSGNFLHATHQDLKDLQDLGLKQIIDLRTTAEIDLAPDPLIFGVNNHHIDYFEGSDTEQVPSSSEFMKLLEKDIVDDPYLIDSYCEMIQSSNGQRGLTKFMKRILNDDPAILWHCSAGKDRTGVSTAIILELLGVEREVIMEDYLKTNDSIDDIMKSMLSKVEGLAIDDNLKKKLTPIFGVEPKYLEKVWDIVDNEYGGMKNYSIKYLELSEQKIIDLKSKYLTL